MKHEITNLNSEQLFINKYHYYEKLLANGESPQRIGLYRNFLEHYEPKHEGLVDIETAGRIIQIPAAVPITDLYWYNNELLNTYYPGKEISLFTHLHVDDQVVDKLTQSLENGEVILLNCDGTSIDKSDELESALVSKFGERLQSPTLPDAFLNQYAGTVCFEGAAFNDAFSFQEVYNRMVAQGTLEDASVKGASIIDVVADEDATGLWDIYSVPFKDISTSSPINAGFDKEGFHDALKDPSVVKIVNRQDSVITTLALFVTKFEQAEWLNEEYFRQQYPEAYNTSNILIFTGIVSDENLRGSMYSLKLIKLLLEVGRERGTNALITFECNEISNNYLPKIVDYAINSSGIATVEGLKKPVAQSKFKALQLVAE